MTRANSGQQPHRRYVAGLIFAALLAAVSAVMLLRSVQVRDAVSILVSSVLLLSSCTTLVVTLRQARTQPEPRTLPLWLRISGIVGVLISGLVDAATAILLEDTLGFDRLTAFFLATGTALVVFAVTLWIGSRIAR